MNVQDNVSSKSLSTKTKNCKTNDKNNVKYFLSTHTNRNRQELARDGQ